MTETAITTKISDVGGVAVPVSDQERALRFYVEKLGFEVRLDVPLGDGGRWLQVAPPAGRVPVALVVAGEGGRLGIDTGITFTTADAEADHAALAWGGVDTDPLLRWPGVPLMFILRDPDRNQLKIMDGAPR
ncbi:MAG TPA: VOC family protein [Acidimicrobiales bacterium]|jgi:catechol 2,3-dioxygenase-like lactoylglutathione lyase family enzyme|nr:VOC family protein [Acidimicrobiales bacterium]